MVVVDVVGRFVFHSPLPATMEMLYLVMPWVIFPCLAYTLLRGEHVRVTLVTNRLSPKAQSYCDAFAYLIGVVLFTLISYRSIEFFWKSFLIREVMDAPMYLPWYVGKFMFPVGIIFFTLQFFTLLLVTVGKLRSQSS
jgi:TRAP-type C4-dicarboxylate transport system permease small subunit